MTNQELIKLAYDMGAHPYSVGSMVAALQKGIEIGKAEQEAMNRTNLDEIKRERDAYYEELLKLRQERVKCAGKKSHWLGNNRKGYFMHDEK